VGVKKMKRSSNYFLTLNKEIIFIGNKKDTEKKRKEYKRNGVKVHKHFSPVSYENSIGVLI